MATATDRLAAKVARLDTLVRGLATGPQMGYSSLEDARIEEYDGNGQLVSIVGKQPDGTHGAVVVSGPNPPRPSAPLASGGPGLLNFGWDGNFADEVTGATDITIPAPLDWARAEVHASPVSGFLAESADTFLDALESPRGGSRTAMLDPGVWYVVLVSRALSGKRSVQSLEVSVEVLAPVGSDVDVEALRDEFQAADAEMNAAIIRNKQTQDTLAGTVTTLQNTTLPALAQDLSSAQGRLDTARTELDRLTGVVPLPTVYAQHIAAATSAFQKADIGNLTVTGNSALNTLTAQRIAANVASFLQVTTDQLIAGSAQLGEAVARKFAAETGAFMKLYANQVYIGQGGNLLIDPQFLDAELNTIRRAKSTGNWTLVPGTSTSSAAMQTTTATTNTQFLFYRGNQPSASNTAELVPVTPGQVYDFSVDITTSATANCRWNLHIQRSDGTVSYSGMTQFSGNGKRELKFSYTVPDGVVGLIPSLACLTSGVTWTIHGNATFREKITPSLIVDGFFQGLRVIGASIETNAAANVGVKFTDNGLVAYGLGTEYDPVAQANLLYDTKASIDTRAPSWTSFPTDRVPGLWFEAVRKTAAGAVPPAVPAALVPSNGPAQGITMQSSQQANGLDYRTNITANQTHASMLAQSNRANINAAPASQTAHVVHSNGWYTQSLAGTTPQAEVRHDGDGILQLFGRNGVSINGNNIVPKAWTLIPMQSGQAALDGNRPAVRIDSTGQFMEFTGGITCGPNGARPAVTFMTISSAVHRPSTFKNFVVATSVGPQGLTIAPSGAMYLNPTGMQTGGWIDLSQLRYAIAGPT